MDGPTTDDDTPTIHVDFLDESGEVMFVADVPMDQLPDSFDADTTLHINGSDWHVVEAYPKQSFEFADSGQLQLTISKVQQVDVSTLLYSIPTVSNDMPPIQVGLSKAYANTLELLDDEWRQVDIVPLVMIETVNENLDLIRRILDQKREGLGFTELHVRTGLDNPFVDEPIELTDLIAGLPDASILEGISFYGMSGLVDQGFALTLPEGAIIYGNTRDGLIDHLGVHGVLEDHGYLRLRDFLIHHFLIIVDWCRAAVYPVEFDRTRNL